MLINIPILFISKRDLFLNFNPIQILIFDNALRKIGCIMSSAVIKLKNKFFCFSKQNENFFSIQI